MAEAPRKRKSWFGLIDPHVLDRSGPGRGLRTGVDVYAGHSPPRLPGDDQTQDVYKRAEQQVKPK